MRQERGRNKTKGVILLFAFLCLSLLSFVVLTFLSLSKISAGIANIDLLKTKTYLTAVSGLEYAQSYILNNFTYNNFNSYTSEWVYTGEDLNRNGELDNNEDVNNNGELDTLLPLEDSVKASFNTPKEFLLQDDVSIKFKVAVFDENTKININWGCNKPDNDKSNQALKRILDSLGRTLNIDNLDNLILNNRKECFKFIEQLKGFLGKHFGVLQHYLTTTSFFYKDMLIPNEERMFISDKTLH